MKITLYNVGFGESIFIQDDYDEYSKGILIDCGSMSNDSKILNTFDEIYMNIKDLHPDALLTHFHMDHLSGFMYFANKKAPIFNNLYIPDIFNLSNSEEIITLVLLEYLLNQVYISSKDLRETLLDFVNGLCGSSEKIILLKRGDIFRDYIVLTPFIEEIEKASHKVYDSIGHFSNEWNKLIHIILDVFDRKINDDNYFVGETILSVFNESQINFNILFEEIEKFKNNNVKKSLNKLNHTINIVFQNNIDTKVNNILFTGDAETSQLKNLTPDFYNEYNIYKIPHHGTLSHLYTDINSKKVIISNSKMKKCKISKKYHEKNYVFYCTNCINCEEWKSHKESNYCNMSGNHLVFPKRKIEI